MNPQSRIAQILGKIENIALSVAGIALLLMGGIVTVSILGRYFFLMPIPDDLTMVGLLMVGVIILPLAFIESQRGHIAVTITTDWMGPRVIGLLRCLGALAMGVFFGGIGFMISLKLPREFLEGTYYDGQLEIPTWPMKVLFAIGIVLFVLRLCFSFASGMRTFITGVDNEETQSHAEEV